MGDGVRPVDYGGFRSQGALGFCFCESVPHWGAEGGLNFFAMKLTPSNPVCSGVDPIFTIKDVAAHMQASQRTVRRIIQAGRIRTIRSGRLVRISASALNSFLQEASCG